MRKMETDMCGGADAPASIDPQELLNYIDKQLREINEGEVSADNVVSVIKRLQKMVSLILLQWFSCRYFSYKSPKTQYIGQSKR